MRKCKALFVCIAFFASFILVGCASKYKEISVNFEQKSYEINIENTKYLLYISKQEKVYYFILYDMLGIPLVSRKLENSSFSNTKFMSRNSSFDDLFYYILKEQNSEFIYKNFKVKEVF